MQAAKLNPNTPSAALQEAPRSPVSFVLPGNYFSLADSFKRALKAKGSAVKTLLNYCSAAQLFGEWLATNERSLNVQDVRPDDIRRWEQDLRDHGNKPSTVNNRHRSLQAFFKWLESEEEIDRNPMLKVAAPELKEIRPLVPVTDEQWQRLLRGCEGKTFSQRRDMAIVRLFLATPLRLSELSNLKAADVDFQNGKVRVLAKGGSYRDVPITAKAEAALDRYLRVRDQHRDARSEWLWLGKRGRLTSWGVAQMMKDRAKAAGFPAFHVHEARATFAATWLREGRSEQGLMRIAGWKSRAMIQRYTTLAADELATDEYRRAAPGDRL